MTMLAHMGNIDKIYKGLHSVPQPYSESGFEIKMWNLNGTITTPWFGEDYVEEYYKEDREFHVVLELPDDVKEQVGSESLIIELDVDTREDEDWVEDVTIYTLHGTSKNWSKAEDECRKDGGHLVSISSEKENQLVERIAASAGHNVWSGRYKP